MRIEELQGIFTFNLCLILYTVHYARSFLYSRAERDQEEEEENEQH